MTLARGGPSQPQPIGGSSSLGAADLDGVLYQTATDTPRVDRISPSGSARRALAAGDAPPCLTIEGLEHAYRRVELGDGRSLVLQNGFYRVLP